MQKKKVTWNSKKPSTTAWRKLRLTEVTGLVDLVIVYPIDLNSDYHKYIILPQFLLVMPLTKYHIFGHFSSLNRCAAASRLMRFLLICCSSHFTYNKYSWNTVKCTTDTATKGSSCCSTLTYMPLLLKFSNVYLPGMYNVNRWHLFKILSHLTDKSFHKVQTIVSI